MTKRKKTDRRHPSRLDRIERKCDRILTELLMMRRTSRSSASSFDDALDRVHDAAMRMRRQCEMEYKAVRDLMESGR